MNNKGFAITGILYGLLVLFLLTFLSFVSVLNARKDRLELLTEEINKIVDINENEKKFNVITTGTPTNQQYQFPFFTTYRGRYEFTGDKKSCSVYLPTSTYVENNAGTLTFTNYNSDICNDGNNNYDCNIYSCTGLGTISEIKIYTSQD